MTSFKNATRRHGEKEFMLCVKRKKGKGAKRENNYYSYYYSVPPFSNFPFFLSLHITLLLLRVLRASVLRYLNRSLSRQFFQCRCEGRICGGIEQDKADQFGLALFVQKSTGQKSDGR
jgi:hypothetical protein